MEHSTIYLHFDTTTAEANRLAEELQDFLQKNEKESVGRVKDNQNSMDAGAIIAIILGAPSIIAISKGIALWLSKRPEASVTFSKDKEKTEIIATGLKSRDIERVMAAAEKITR